MWLCKVIRMKSRLAEAGLGKAQEPLVLDVRPIFARGEAPCSTIDGAIAKLKEGQCLVLLAPFEPVPLYTKLGNLGFEHQVQPLEDGGWRIEFRPGTKIPAMPSAVPRCACSGAEG